MRYFSAVAMATGYINHCSHLYVYFCMSKDIEPSAPVAMENPDLKIIFDPEWNMVGTDW